MVPPGWPLLVEPPNDPDWQHFLAAVGSVDGIAPGGALPMPQGALTAGAPCNDMQGVNSSANDMQQAAGVAFAARQGSGAATAAALAAAAAGSSPGCLGWGSAPGAGMGIFSTVIYPHQALAVSSAVLRCLGDLTMHLQQHQHMPQGCSSPLLPMCDWLAAAWHVEVLSGLMAVLPATAPPALIAAAVSADKAAPADAAAPNRVALHLMGHVLLLCSNRQQLGGGAGAGEAAGAASVSVSYAFVLQLLWQLQQGLAALQRTAAAAPHGTFLSCRQLLQAYVASMPSTSYAGECMVTSTVMELTQYL